MRTTRTSPLQTQELTQVILYILLSSETNRLGKTTNYYYNDRGSKVREDFDIYRFSYRDHGELYEVRVNGNVKVTYDYINSGTLKDLLNSVIYNNGDVINYSYDQYGQLTQTADTANGFTESYTYDSRGNILSKTKVYDDENVPAETTNFSYTNSDWQDELTSVNGTPLTYDANGNVLTYGNMEFEWTNGRVLSQITVNLEDPNGTADVYSYTYDESGIRSSKTVNGVTTYFTTKDGVILSQTDGTNTMYFQYDNSGNPTGFIYNGTQYFYLTNQMGDVIGISDNTGSLIATYTYGAWGEVLTVTPSRFINSDKLEIASIEKEQLSGGSLFVYCGNNPLNESDENGTLTLAIFAKYALKMLVGALGVYASDIVYSIIRGYRGKAIFTHFWSKLSGYISGAISALLPGNRYVRAAGSAAISSLTSSFQQMLKSRKKMSLRSVVLVFLKSFVFNMIAAVISKLFALAVNRLTPKNYSSFAHSRYLKDANLTPKQIRSQMAARFKQIKVASMVFEYIAGVVSGAASRKKYRWA